MITKKYLLLIGWLMFSLAAWADVQVTASAPDVVVVGDQFRLSYKVNTQDIDDFSAPAVSGFDILMGPSRSMQSSFQMINGRTTQSSSVTFTYILNATKAGTTPSVRLQWQWTVKSINPIPCVYRFCRQIRQGVTLLQTAAAIRVVDGCIRRMQVRR